MLTSLDTGRLRTIEAAGSMVVGSPKSADDRRLLNTASPREEAIVIATILWPLNPN